MLWWTTPEPRPQIYVRRIISYAELQQYLPPTCFTQFMLICRNVFPVWPLPFSRIVIQHTRRRSRCLLMSSLLLSGLRAVWNRTDRFTFAITATLRFIFCEAKAWNLWMRCRNVNMSFCLLGDNATWLRIWLTFTCSGSDEWWEMLVKRTVTRLKLRGNVFFIRPDGFVLQCSYVPTNSCLNKSFSVFQNVPTAIVFRSGRKMFPACI